MHYLTVNFDFDKQINNNNHGSPEISNDIS